jgi:YYY domain-containing protein
MPLLFRLLRWLPDRGYSVAKPVGLLLGNYVLWLVGALGWLRNTEGGILLSFGLVALLGAWVYRRWDDGPRLRDWLRDHKWLVAAYELVFLIAFVGWAIFRAHNPDLSTTEKPMEFAFMNAIGRSQTFPPHDPWLSGFGISYYYFGYVMMSTLMKLSAVNSGVAFSLSNTLWFALTTAGAFGVAANLAAASKRTSRAAVVGAGLLAALFVTVLGNFQGPLEVAHANGAGSAEFWRWLDIQEINTPPRLAPGEVSWPFCDACAHPRGSWWFWRASRVVHDYPLGSDRSNPAEYQELIDEFPFFSFLLGDMHPHVLALPYALMSLALALNLFRMGSDLGEETEGTGGTEGTEGTRRAGKKSAWRLWFWDAAPIAVMYPIFLGALSFLNTWDFPIHVFIAALAWGLGRWLAARRTGAVRTSAVWGDAAIALIVCGLMGVIAYLPFYIGFRSQAAGLAPNVYNPTRLPQFFVMFGPFLLIIGVLLITLIARAVRDGLLTPARGLFGPLLGGIAAIVAASGLTALMTGLFLLVSTGIRSKVEELIAGFEAQGIHLAQAIAGKLAQFGVPLLLGVAMSAIVIILYARAGANRRAPDDEPALPFALLLFGVGALLTFAVEYVFLLDQFGTRMNTVFKLYYQAWAMWGVASAYAVFYLWSSSERLVTTVGRVAFASVVAVSIIGGSVYPILAVQSGTAGHPDQPTLDARAPTAQFAPDEVAAIDWLNASVTGAPVLLESEGASYRSETSRVSAWTGMPGVLGWVGHEGQWRGTYADISPRQPDIDRIYQSTDPVSTLDLLRKYNVEYVYVGPNELAKYPPEGLAKFSAIADVVFQQGQSTIYRVLHSAGLTSIR